MKNKIAVFIAYTVLMMIYSLIIFFLVMSASQKVRDMQTSYSQMLSTWKEPVITDIQTIPYDKQCSSLPSNTSSYWENMYQYQFDGFTDGCDCRDISYYSSQHYNIYRSLVQGHCDYNQTRANCNRIYTAFQPTNFTHIFDKTACARREKGVTLYAQRTNYGSCEMSQKKCGKDDYEFCVDKIAPCPITNIVFSSQKPKDKEYNKTVQLDSNVYLSLDREIKGNEKYSYPMTLFRINQGSHMCLTDYTTPNLAHSREYSYTLLTRQVKRCQYYPDTRFQRGASITEEKLFQQNAKRVMYKFPAKDGGIKVFNPTVDYHLFSRQYIPWSSSRTCQRLFQKLYDSKPVFDSMTSAQHSVYIVSIFIVIIMAIWSILMAINLCGKDLPCVPGEKSQERAYLLICRTFIYYLLKIIQLGFLISAFNHSSQVSLFYKDITYEKCSDDITNAEFQKQYQLITSDVYNVNIGCLIMLIIVLCLDSIIIFFYVYQHFYSKKKQSNNKEKYNDDDYGLKPDSQNQLHDFNQNQGLDNQDQYASRQELIQGQENYTLQQQVEMLQNQQQFQPNMNNNNINVQQQYPHMDNQQNYQQQQFNQQNQGNFDYPGQI